MKRRLVGFIVMMFVMTVAGPALADAEPNGNNCVGASASSAPKPGFGPVVADIAQSEPGAIADLVSGIRAAGC